jgi:hypothetical protein
MQAEIFREPLGNTIDVAVIDRFGHTMKERFVG